MENVFIILCDTLRAKSLPQYGNTCNTIPNLTSIIESDFIVYKRAYAPAPWTIPSLLSLFTGLYPSHVMETPASLTLDDNFKTLAGLFKDSGYKTTGISTNALVAKKFNFHREFDSYLQLWLPDVHDDDIFIAGKETNKLKRLFHLISSSGHLKNTYKYLRQKTYKKRHDIIENSTYSTVRSFKILKNLIDKNNSKKGFYFINLMQTHEKYNPPDKTRNVFVKDNSRFEECYKEKTAQDHYAIHPFSEDILNYLKLLYEEEILYLDIVIFDFIDFLKKKGLYDKSMIVVTSDHGEHFGENGHFTHWFSVYEPVIRIPIYIKWPGKSENISRVKNELVMLHDLYSTFLNLLNHWHPSPYSSYDLNSTKKRSWILSQLPDIAYPVEGCQKKNKEFSLKNLGLNESSLNAYVFNNGLKIIENGNNVVQYNLKHDPGEENPLAGDKELLQSVKSEILP